MKASPDLTSSKHTSELDEVKNKYEMLISSEQKITACNYINNAIKSIIKAGDYSLANKIFIECINGVNMGSNLGYFNKEIITKIGTKSKKPRIMFCIGFWLTGGMERVMSTVFDQLSKDYEIFLLSSYDGRDSKIEIPAYVVHLNISTHNYYDSYDVTALSYAKLLDIDLVIGFMNLFQGQLEFYDLCAKSGIKTIASNHETFLYPYVNKNHYLLAQKRINTYTNSVDAVLWLTNYSAAMYGLLANNSYLMPNPNTYDVKSSNSINKKDKVILCVGRFNDSVKRVDRIIKVYSIVIKEHPDAKLVLVGKYDMEMLVGDNAKMTLDEYIDYLKISRKNIKFVGEVSNVDDYYKQATVLLLTSMNEGFGMVINEAACFGVPSVCSKLYDLEDLITDGVNGYLIDQNNTKKMALKVGNILSDEKLRNMLGNNAIKLVKRFDANIIGDKWKELISSLLDNKIKIDHLKDLLGYTYSDYRLMSTHLIKSYGDTVENDSKIYNKINLDYKKMENLNIELSNELQNARNEIDDLRNKVNNLDTELDSIYKSKKWKYASKISDLKNSITKHKDFK